MLFRCKDRLRTSLFMLIAVGGTTRLSASLSFPRNVIQSRNLFRGKMAFRRRFSFPKSSLPMGVDADSFCEVADGTGATAYELLCLVKEGDECTEYSRLMRVEKEPDGVWNTIETKSQVMEKIKETQDCMAGYGRADLYNREWEWFQQASGSSKETSVINGASSPYQSNGDEVTFSAMQFNMLAEGLSSGLDSPVPFPTKRGDCGQLDKQAYGGFSVIPHPEITLNFENRRWRLLQVLFGEDGSAPYDLIAMEEVDRFVGFFRPALRIFGYDGVFYPKPRSPGARMGWYSDGCALSWKRDVFELVDQTSFEYKAGNQIMAIVTLRHKDSGRAIVSAVTHLKAQKSAANEKIRCLQVKEFLRRVEDAVQVAKETNGDGADIPVVIFGDFNADPPADVEGSDSAIAEFAKRQPHTLGTYQSVYDFDPPRVGFYTTLKTRGTKTTKRIIDYIFYRGKLKCEARLTVPDETELEITKMPGLRYPSDHFAIGAKFRVPS